jgi:hypothetical protein
VPIPFPLLLGESKVFSMIVTISRYTLNTILLNNCSAWWEDATNAWFEKLFVAKTSG